MSGNRARGRARDCDWVHRGKRGRKRGEENGQERGEREEKEDKIGFSRVFQSVCCDLCYNVWLFYFSKIHPHFMEDD